jgi:hypothetical protein
MRKIIFFLVVASAILLSAAIPLLRNKVGAFCNGTTIQATIQYKTTEAKKAGKSDKATVFIQFQEGSSPKYAKLYDNVSPYYIGMSRTISLNQTTTIVTLDGRVPPWADRKEKIRVMVKIGDQKFHSNWFTNCGYMPIGMPFYDKPGTFEPEDYAHPPKPHTTWSLWLGKK